MQNEDCNTCHKHPPYCRCAAPRARSQSGAKRSPAGVSAFSDGFVGSASADSEEWEINPKWSRDITLAWFNHLTDRELIIVWNFANSLTQQRKKNRRFTKH